MKTNIFSILFLFFVSQLFAADSLIAPGGGIEKVLGAFKFTEGPAVDADGNIFFVDDPDNKIYHYSIPDGKLTVFVSDSAHANGTFVDADGNLIACEGGTGAVVSYDKNGKRTVIADTFEGKRFNKPNDLWIDPKGGIYFTDPVYGKDFTVIQDGEHLYYITPERNKVLKVDDKLIKPNGLIGTANGKTLYVTDPKDSKVWQYDIAPNGTLENKRLFASIGVDGMTIDERGNVYITEKEVIIFNPEGVEIERIKFPEVPANVCFGGKDRKTLFVTARTSLYKVPMVVSGQR